MADQQEAQK
jgi:hypothetical protein